MLIAIYPGTFDPITMGHLDIMERACKLFDKLIVGVAMDVGKATLFNADERVELIKGATAHLKNIEVEAFSGLLVEYSRNKGAKVIIKGLRAVSDFEGECQMALMNKNLAPELETLFMMTSEAYSFLSSSIVKEIAQLGGNIENLVPKNVAEALLNKLKGEIKR